MSRTTVRVRLARFPVTLFLGVIALVSLSASGVTQERSSHPTTNALPITAVNLFTSGVGYFQHDGVVEGDSEIQLTFSTTDVNDLLKSLVLQDFDGGSIEAVTYPSQDPLARILGSFSIDVADNPPFAELVNRSRGARVEVQGAVNATGIVSGVEYHTVQTDAGAQRLARLNLVTPAGIRQVAFSDIRSLRFTDAALQRELEAALQVIADNRRQDRKTITIRFTGHGSRRVRVGYVRAVPVWKTSYRVVLADDGTAQIQGWAIVENTSEADWTDVQLALVSGRPISFIMDLYSPIYLSRPRVQPEVGVQLAPPQYERDVPVGAPPARASSRAMEMEAMDSFADEAALGGTQAAPAPIDLSQGVSSAVSQESGASYRVDHAVSIPRRGAALIPIVATSIPAHRLSIFDASVLSNRPLSAVELTNATRLQLPAGPATLFDGAGYAGDARLPEMIAGEDRFVSYAVDLDSTVVVRPVSEPETITGVRIVSGVMEVTVQDRRSTEYVVQRLSDDVVDHLIVHPRLAGWEIVGDVQPESESAGSYRFRMTPEPGATVVLQVVERRVRSRSIALTSIGEDQIAFYLSQRTTDDRTARALRRIRELRSELARIERERREVEQQISVIYREQERIRANIDVLSPDTDLYQRYLESMSSQEELLGELQRRVQEARQREADARDRLREYIESL